MMLANKFRSALPAAMIVLSLSAAPALGWCYEEPSKKVHCNSGNGNGSEPITFVPGQHCYGGDPGNSYKAGNKGGDEIPTSGGVPNPGGNNVP